MRPKGRQASTTLELSGHTHHTAAPRCYPSPYPPTHRGGLAPPPTLIWPEGRQAFTTSELSGCITLLPFMSCALPVSLLAR